LPVATTATTIGPRATDATWAGSTLADARLPDQIHPAPSTRIAAPAATATFRDFFID
jgi:hypothetical protein